MLLVYRLCSGPHPHRRCPRHARYRAGGFSPRHSYGSPIGHPIGQRTHRSLQGGPNPRLIRSGPPRNRVVSGLQEEARKKFDEMLVKAAAEADKTVQQRIDMENASVKQAEADEEHLEDL